MSTSSTPRNKLDQLREELASIIDVIERIDISSVMESKTIPASERKIAGIMQRIEAKTESSVKKANSLEGIEVCLQPPVEKIKEALSVAQATFNRLANSMTDVLARASRAEAAFAGDEKKVDEKKEHDKAQKEIENLAKGLDQATQRVADQQKALDARQYFVAAVVKVTEVKSLNANEAVASLQQLANTLIALFAETSAAVVSHTKDKSADGLGPFLGSLFPQRTPAESEKLAEKLNLLAVYFAEVGSRADMGSSPLVAAGAMLSALSLGNTPAFVGRDEKESKEKQEKHEGEMKKDEAKIATIHAGLSREPASAVSLVDKHLVVILPNEAQVQELKRAKIQALQAEQKDEQRLQAIKALDDQAKEHYVRLIYKKLVEQGIVHSVGKNTGEKFADTYGFKSVDFAEQLKVVDKIQRIMHAGQNDVPHRDNKVQDASNLIRQRVDDLPKLRMAISKYKIREDMVGRVLNDKTTTTPQKLEKISIFTISPDAEQLEAQRNNGYFAKFLRGLRFVLSLGFSPSRTEGQIYVNKMKNLADQSIFHHTLTPPAIAPAQQVMSSPAAPVAVSQVTAADATAEEKQPLSPSMR